jgi:hypothetical protein
MKRTSPDKLYDFGIEDVRKIESSGDGQFVLVRLYNLNTAIEEMAKQEFGESRWRERYAMQDRLKREIPSEYHYYFQRCNVGSGDPVEVDCCVSDSALPSYPLVRELISNPLRLWVFRQLTCRISPKPALALDEQVLRFKHFVLSQERELRLVKREIEAFEQFETSRLERREPVPDDVRMFVWRRDGGKCVKCGSGELLEFDHIIPVIEGGSNTERNLQLLCEPCNRGKGRRV